MKCNQIVVKTLDFESSDRFAVMKHAYEIGIRGFVQRINQTDFLVEAEGEESTLQTFIDFLSKETMYIKTIGIEVSELALKHYKSFEMI